MNTLDIYTIFSSVFATVAVVPDKNELKSIVLFTQNDLPIVYYICIIIVNKNYMSQLILKFQNRHV